MNESINKIINYQVINFVRFIYLFYNNYFYYLFLKLFKKFLEKIYGKKNYNIMFNHICSPGNILWILFVLTLRSNRNLCNINNINLS